MLGILNALGWISEPHKLGLLAGPEIPALERWGQEYQGFKVILSLRLI